MNNNQCSNIVLIGFMGTGKSAVSADLSVLSGWPAIDTDAEIVKTEGQSIPDIFAEHGERYFRTSESDVLRKVFARRHQVVSTGGGAVLAKENRQLMLESGFVVALTADPEVIIERVSQQEDRPLLAGDARQKVYDMLEKRKGVYDFAHLTIDTSILTPAEIAAKIWSASANGKS